MNRARLGLQPNAGFIRTGCRAFLLRERLAEGAGDVIMDQDVR
jgi:hypothetical protein